MTARTCLDRAAGALLVPVALAGGILIGLLLGRARVGHGAAVLAAGFTRAALSAR